MDDHDDWLYQRFETHRTHLRAVAYRMLGSISEADDAVQEAWLRLSRSDTSAIQNPGGWLTTVVGRVCLDMLRARGRAERRPRAGGRDRPRARSAAGRLGRFCAAGGTRNALSGRAARVRAARHVRRTLRGDRPHSGAFPERGQDAREPRARRRVRGATNVPEADLTRQREVVDAFLAAAHDGDFGALLVMSDPDVVLRADCAAVEAGASREIRGAPAVADTFSGRARFAQPALVNGVVGAVWAPRGRPRVVFGFTITRGKIVEIDILADPARLRRLDLAILAD
jgi:DNA-directed RNA polymerase specialized sigma24 family protein